MARFFQPGIVDEEAAEYSGEKSLEFWQTFVSELRITLEDSQKWTLSLAHGA
jgi:hypothetical protein